MQAETLCQSNRKSLKIIVLDKLVKVDAQHFENDEDMTSENKIFFDTHNIFGIVVVGVPQCFQNLNFNLALLVQFLPILKNLYSTKLFCLMIKASHNNAKSPSSKFFLNFISVSDLVLGIV